MKYFLVRLLKLVPIIVGVTLITFSLIYLGPSDPAKMHFFQEGQAPTEEMLENFRNENGLNDSFIAQYLRWWNNFLHGDLGKSYSDGKPTSYHIKKSMPYTVYLSLNSIVITLIVSIPLGFYMAIKPKSLLSKFLSSFSILSISLPNFIVALLLIYILSSRLKLLPILTNDLKIGIIMPVLTLVISMSAKYIRQVKVMTEKALEKDHIYGLRARGISELNIFFKTILKNISVEIITLVGMSIGSLLGGVAIVETIFNWPGLGSLMVKSVLVRDIPVIQGVVVWMALAYVLINLATDILYAVFDPRIRLGEEDGSLK